MKRLTGIFALMLGLMISGYRMSAQEPATQADSLQIKKQKNQSELKYNAQNNQGQGNIQKDKGNGVQAVKRVKAGRPDMTRAKGARPPMIVRPSGSGIPKGVGKPGGAGRKVGR
ncbi:MAG: hypothetical protein Q8868_12340 [Bacteroidota bacterium]|nr:hypothetical protein [Bacteroidota bacterium]